MKKMRKGFTLVELLIVIGIMGTLAAAMSMASGRASASAKASTIVSNVEACKIAAAMYLSDNYAADLSATEAKAFLKVRSAYIPNFGDFSTGAIKYTVGTGKGYKEWSIYVNFENEADAVGIQYALAKHKGYEDLNPDEQGEGVCDFVVRLYSGVVTAGTSMAVDNLAEPDAPTAVTTTPTTGG